MPVCSQVSYSIVVVMRRQMPNRQCTSSLCLGVMLAHSSGVGVSHAFMGEQVQQHKAAPNLIHAVNEVNEYLAIYSNHIFA